MVTLAKEDYRDLIMAAEYDSFQIQLRDFNSPFGSESVPDPLEEEWRRSMAKAKPPEPTHTVVTSRMGRALRRLWARFT
jgi:hypothetical protein